MFTVKQNAAISTLAVSVAFSLLEGSAAADTDSSNSRLGAPAGLMGVADIAVAAERDRAGAWVPGHAVQVLLLFPRE